MELEHYIRAIFALILVIGLIGSISFIARKFLTEGGISIKKNTDKRLSIEEIRPIDARRKFVLIKKDNQEHLILIGTNSDLLIESNPIKAK